MLLITVHLRTWYPSNTQKGEYHHQKSFKGEAGFFKNYFYFLLLYLFYEHACFACMYAMCLLVFLKGRRKHNSVNGYKLW